MDIRLSPQEAQFFVDNKERFSFELNGYNRTPIEYYAGTLPFINQDGKILDIGCGNGMLLRYLVLFSGKKLVPYGIDLRESPISQAREVTFREFAGNFITADAHDYQFEGNPFNTIITNPSFGATREDDKAMIQFCGKCIKNLVPGGRLILRIHDEFFKHRNISSFQEIPEFASFGFSFFPYRQGEKTQFEVCVFDKEKERK